MKENIKIRFKEKEYALFFNEKDHNTQTEFKIIPVFVIASNHQFVDYIFVSLQNDIFFNSASFIVICLNDL